MNLTLLRYELCTLRLPFQANNQGALIVKIMEGKFAPISRQYSKALSELVQACLTHNQAKRPSVTDVLQRPAVISQAAKLCIPLPGQADLTDAPRWSYYAGGENLGDTLTSFLSSSVNFSSSGSFASSAQFSSSAAAADARPRRARASSQALSAPGTPTRQMHRAQRNRHSKEHGGGGGAPAVSAAGGRGGGLPEAATDTLRSDSSSMTSSFRSMQDARFDWGSLSSGTTLAIAETDRASNDSADDEKDFEYPDYDSEADPAAEPAWQRRMCSHNVHALGPTGANSGVGGGGGGIIARSLNESELSWQMGRSKVRALHAL